MEHALDRPSDQTAKSRSLAAGRAAITRGVAGAYSQLIAFFLFVSMVGNLWLGYALLQQSRAHKAEMQNNYTVFREASDGTTTAHNAAEFRTGPSEAQLNAVAWRVVSLIESAGSADVHDNYRKAKAEMTKTLATDFDETFGRNAEEIAKLGVYNVFDQPEMRQAVPNDFPPVERLEKLTKYDRIVVGTRTTYFVETREPVDRAGRGKRVAYYVRLVPLPAPEVTHSEGLLVDTIIPIKLKGESNE